METLKGYTPENLTSESVKINPDSRLILPSELTPQQRRRLNEGMFEISGEGILQIEEEFGARKKVDLSYY